MITKRVYDDSTGRLRRESIYKSGSEHFYTRYVYPYESGNSYNQSASFSVLIAGKGEVESRRYYDGAGRVLKSRTPHRSTTSGTWNWAGTKVEYDILGRATKTTVPMEVNSNFAFIGDDSSRTDWLWNHTEYDWNNRPIRQIKTDGDPNATENDSDVKISYSGCGCAGGQVTTIEGEEIIEKDWDGSNPNSLGRRTQKVYQDVLGRNWKTEVMEWDGTTPYLTILNEFNGRDQITKVAQTDHSGTSNVSQVTDITYDGFGRRKTTKTPQQDFATSYEYNDDDSIQSMTDAREIITAYTYNNQGLVTNISYDNTADTNIYDLEDVIFHYDDLGNRTKMEDDTGETTYVYNQLSQMISETRKFDDTLSNAPTNDEYTISYSYTLAGQLASIKDPFDDQINYTHDKMGRLTSVDGATAFDGVTNYADNPHYRAWGATQSLEYGNGLKMEMTFNDRFQTDTFKLINPTTNNTHMDKEYEYYSDGKLRKLNDKIDYDDGFGNMIDKFDRLNKYDHMGRPKVGLSGEEARGGTVAQADKEKELPYNQSYNFNAFSNMTERLNEHWGETVWNYNNFNLNFTYLNNRIGDPGWYHDADGRVTQSPGFPNITYAEYDVKGQVTRLYKTETSDLNRFYDGNGRETKRNQKRYSQDENGNDVWTDGISYYVRSTVLGGQVLTNLDDTGRKTRTFVFASGTTLAWQSIGYDTNNNETETVKLNFSDASGMSHRSADSDGDVAGFTTGLDSSVELDPLGGNVGLSTPYNTSLPNGPIQPESPQHQNPTPWHEYSNNPNTVRYMLDGVEVPHFVGEQAVSSGVAIPASLAQYQNVPGFEFESVGVGLFKVTVPRQVGWHVNKDQSITRIFSTLHPKTYIFGVGNWNPQQNRETQRPVDDKKKKCVFNINLIYPDEWIGTDTETIVKDDLLEIETVENGFLRVLKDTIRRIFENAGATVVFNNPEAAKGTRRGNYNLDFREKKFSKLIRLAQKFGFVDKELLGVSYGNNGEVLVPGHSATELAATGGHEVGHYILGKMPGAPKDGHTALGIMRPTDKIEPTVGNFFTPEQAKYLSTLCNENAPK